MSTETQVTIPGPPDLEGRYAPGSVGGAGIVTHPHPLYGGSMDNNVVFALCRAFERAGLGWLRFNFRGVGDSEGRFEEGSGEADDVQAAGKFLVDQGHGRVFLTGYSYGAWALGRVADPDPLPAATVLVAPPAGFMTFECPERLRAPILVVAGDQDEFCSRTELDRLFSALPEPKSLEILRGIDHFFGGAEARLTDLVADFLARVGSGKPTAT